jgi:hypothetical protein
MRYAFFAVLLILLGACSRTDSTRVESADAASTAAPAEPMDTTRAPAVNVQSDTLKMVERRHRFSSPSTDDTFRLVLRGSSLLAGEATFTITNSGGETIFREVVSASDLEAAMVYEMKNATATQAEREAFVRRRMDDFFADKNFRTPAVKSQETYQAGPIDRTTWDDLRRRPDSIGFQYLVGKEDGRRIAWSPLKQQVVRIGSFGG